MKMPGLKNSLFITAEHFPINFNIFGQTVDGSPAIINFTRHVYIIEKFKTKMLINNDILNPEMMVPTIGKHYLRSEPAKAWRLNLMSKTSIFRSNELYVPKKNY